MNYYNEIKNKLIDNEIYERTKNVWTMLKNLEGEF